MIVPRKLAFAPLLAAALFLSSGTVTVNAQTAPQSTGKPAEIEPRSTEGKTATQEHWDQTQLLTSTVHQAWLLSGKNEANFFEMVEQLADLSAKNRGITLPEDAAAGRRMGEFIKRTAAADTDQLLYAVVDKAVKMTSGKPVHKAGSSATPKS